MSSENHQFIRKYGWKWGWLEEKQTIPTHWRYGATVIRIPKIYKEVYV